MPWHSPKFSACPVCQVCIVELLKVLEKCFGVGVFVYMLCFFLLVPQFIVECFCSFK